MRDSQDHSLLSQDGQNFAAAADSKVSRILNVDLMIGNLSRPPKSTYRAIHFSMDSKNIQKV